VFIALSQVFDDAKGVIEDGGIVRQRHATEIAVLAIESPDIEKISRQLVLPTFFSCGTATVRLQDAARE
jgi:hypothetical protein